MEGVETTIEKNKTNVGSGDRVFETSAVQPTSTWCLDPQIGSTFR